MKTVREMKSALDKMNRLYEESDRLFLDDEDASDRLYQEGFAIQAEIADTLVKISFGCIDKKTANTMVFKKEYQARLLEILEKFA